MPSTPRNRIGEVYGQLTVVRSSQRRTKSGNAYWWCQCICGREREVPGDKLSLNTARRKPTVNACEECARERQVEGVYRKNDREEKERRLAAVERRAQLKDHVPERWLSLPLTDAHARELGQTLFFRGTTCLRGHLAPSRINGGCLTCAGQCPSAEGWPPARPKES
ncbi:MAG: early protein (E6) [Synechococcus sp. BS307-5m-G38]|nr:early protein (E6) [Synechococcus sp. BS307-5m-G38]